MPYCSKCGAELDEDTKFCPKCGTPVGPPVARPVMKREKRPINVLAIVLIALLVIAAVIVAIVAITFLPIRAVDAERRMSVPYTSGIDTLNLDLIADVASVNIAFEDLADEVQSSSIILDASATARAGVFASPDSLERFMPVWHDETEGNVLTVTVRQDVDTLDWRWYSSLKITFDIRIDLSMDTSLDIRTGTGGILVDTEAGVNLNSLSLEATTGGVEANLVNDVVVAGDISVETTTGGVKLYWENVIVTNDIQVDALTTTGGVVVDVKQDEELLWNVDMKADATTGGVDFAVEIQGDVGAKIEYTVTTGGIDVDRQVGFSGTAFLLRSDNYPASHNFDVILETTTGGIDIDAKYTP